MTLPPMQPIEITDAALNRIQHLLAVRGKPAYGIRIGLKTKGCTGLSYAIEYADDKQPFDEEVIKNGIHVLIDPKVIMFILGTTMDYVEDKIKSGFVFENPNEKGRCGCGKSFHV
ncbi:MAG: iron-sulfur cluster assembly accessory protein [Alphaproteobacteria bacterium]|nr:iron-sulfur cluster assembly accessory protein [Alphaproteobacteria bacterium]